MAKNKSLKKGKKIYLHVKLRHKNEDVANNHIYPNIHTVKFPELILFNLSQSYK